MNGITPFHHSSGNSSCNTYLVTLPKDIKSALKFQSSTVLFKKAKELHLPDAQAVYRFRDPAYNFATPSLDWSITAPRNRRGRLCGREQLPA